jgi:CubicO group peptidase (beta-lactamase class C family)
MNLVERMQHYKVPGVSIAFFERGKITWTRVYGYADAETKRVVTPETLFQAASISKTAAAIAALRLVQEGKLALDENVNAKLHSWKIPENEFTREEKVTLRRILSHTAGLTVTGFPGYTVGDPVPTVLQVLNGEQPANTKAVRVDTLPGSIWRYSGGGYTAMQLLMTDVTGKPFPQLLEQLVLRPAHMSHSIFAQPLPGNFRHKAAIAYQSDGKRVMGGFHTYPEMAAAGLWTTGPDLARMAIEIQKAYAGTSTSLLSQQMANQMLTRQKDNWGLGVSLSDTDHNLRFGHGGSNEGFRCSFEAYAGSGQGIVIMTNADSGDPLISEIERAVAKEYGWPDFQPKQRAVSRVDPEVITQYAGHYQITAGEVIRIKLSLTVTDGRLYLQADPFGTQPVEMFPESATEFFSAEGFSITLRSDVSGGARQVTLHAGQDYAAEKMD